MRQGNFHPCLLAALIYRCHSTSDFIRMG